MTTKINRPFLTSTFSTVLIVLVFLSMSAETSQAQTPSPGPYIDVVSVLPMPNATLHDRNPVVGGSGRFYNSEDKSYDVTYKFFCTKNGGTEQLVRVRSKPLLGDSTVIFKSVSDDGATDSLLSYGHYTGRFFVSAHPTDNSGDILGTATAPNTLTTDFTVEMQQSGPGGEAPGGGGPLEP